MGMRGLLLDYGGVLTTSVVESFAAFCASEGVDPDTFRAAVLETARTPDSIFHRVEIGAISQEEFDAELAAIISTACGIQVVPDGLKQRLFATSTPNEPMLAAVRKFRANGVRTALVSNSWGGNDYPRDSFDELFDAVVISGEVGLRKPDPEIYLLAAAKVGLDASECVFVDDFRVNCEGAEAVGMMALLQRDTEETLARLATLFEGELER